MSASFIRGMILPIDGGLPVQFQWNPHDINGPGAQATWSPIAVAGREFPYLQYASGQQSNIQFDLWWSTESDHGASVTAAFWALNSLTTPIPRGMSYSRPPIVMLILGSFLRELSVVCEVRPNFIIGTGMNFANTLLPAEAKISVNLWRWRG
jgi:hypothetical protein